MNNPHESEKAPSAKPRLLLDYIGNELKLLWPQLDAYQELFVVEQEKRRFLMQSTAPGFFSIMQVSLAESILMRVFRLMDPDKGRGGENSSFQNLHKALRKGVAESQPVRKAIKKLQVDWKCAEVPYAALLALRNKHIRSIALKATRRTPPTCYGVARYAPQDTGWSDLGGVRMSHKVTFCT
jgi:hypothetical protein